MMADTQHFCLRWNNYQSSITSAFDNLRDDEDFVDVTLACEGKSLKAHRVVLSACSPYFRELLKSTPCKHPVIVLQDVAFADLHALVEFIYHGEVNVHQRNLTSFLKTAEVLRVSGLTQQADDRDEFPNQSPSMLRGYMQYGFSEKLGDDALFASPPSPSPTTSGGATVNQLLRRAAAAALATNRRERPNSSTNHLDPDPSQSPVQPSKRARTAAAAAAAAQGVESNNHNSETTSASTNQVTPTDFSTSSLPKNSQQSSSSSSSRKGEQDGNLEQESSPSPTSGLLDGVKSEPVEMMCANAEVENSSDSVEAAQELGPGPGHLQTHQSAEDQQDHDSIQGHPAASYLTPESKLFGSTPESKLFGSTPESKLFGSGTPDSKLFGSVTPGGTFNFSMAALSADHSGLSGIANQSLQGGADAAGTSTPGGGGGVRSFMLMKQSGVGGSGSGRGWGSEGSGRPSKGTLQCPHCDKCLLNRDTLARHVLHMHQEPLYASKCTVCNREYRTRNSLMVHMSRYHRKKTARPWEVREEACDAREQTSSATVASSSYSTDSNELLSHSEMC